MRIRKRCFLPRNASKRRALDVGGGTGFASVQLARMGYEVLLLDGSEEMLAIARRQGKAGGVAARIFFCHADAGQLGVPLGFTAIARYIPSRTG